MGMPAPGDETHWAAPVSADGARSHLLDADVGGGALELPGLLVPGQHIRHDLHHAVARGAEPLPLVRCAKVVAHRDRKVSRALLIWVAKHL